MGPTAARAGDGRDPGAPGLVADAPEIVEIVAAFSKRETRDVSRGVADDEVSADVADAAGDVERAFPDDRAARLAIRAGQSQSSGAEFDERPGTIDRRADRGEAGGREEGRISGEGEAARAGGRDFVTRGLEVERTGICVEAVGDGCGAGRAGEGRNELIVEG